MGETLAARTAEEKIEISLDGLWGDILDIGEQSRIQPENFNNCPKDGTTLEYAGYSGSGMDDMAINLLCPQCRRTYYKKPTPSEWEGISREMSRPIGSDEPVR